MAARSIVTAAVWLALGACTSSSPVGPPAGKESAPVASANASVPEIPSAGLRAVQDYATEFCSGKAVPLDCPKGAIPAALRRPHDLPSVEAGGSCPVSQPNPRIWARAAPGLGPGPVAPVGLGDQSILRFRRFAGSSWGGQKVLWVAAPSYGGPVLIRGARIDGPGGVGFNLGGDGRPLAEMQLPP